MELLRKLPKIDKLAANSAFLGKSTAMVAKIAREKIENLRQDILSGKVTDFSEDEIIKDILSNYKMQTSSSLISLINATGIIIHTNLGRSPLHHEIFEKAKDIACGYSNLEYDLEQGHRGERYVHLTKLLCSLLNVEDALVVNNNASAVFLVLNTFARKKQAVVSRGELVEIGGSFRIPEVMKASGAKLVEIGTTNRTKLSDYKNAINKKTSILMKVHQSNFSIEGFTHAPSYEEIIDLARQNDLIDYFDAGGAYIKDMKLPAKEKELDLEYIMGLNPSLVSFSGDKLLGSVQAGVIVGKKKYIEKLKKNQLLRMLRVDKVTLSLLEATILAYMEDKTELIPTINLLSRSENELEKLCESVSQKLPSDASETVKTSSYVGGGTMPNRKIPSRALHIKGDATKLERDFRKNGVIGRIENDMFLLDFRSILEQDLKKLTLTIKDIL